MQLKQPSQENQNFCRETLEILELLINRFTYFVIIYAYLTSFISFNVRHNITNNKKKNDRVFLILAIKIQVEIIEFELLICMNPMCIITFK